MVPIPSVRRRGFTLIELVVVIVILAVLAAVAVPRFVDLGRNARIATATALAGALNATSDHLHTVCLATPGCDVSLGGQTTTLGGRPARLSYGTPDAGDTIGVDEIDVWVVHTGFTASVPWGGLTYFAVDDAPDPANCGVGFYDAFYNVPQHVTYTTLLTGGC